MLSLETERRLAELLYEVSKGEMQVEMARQDLSQQYDFEAYSVFRNLDRYSYGSLSSNDIRLFLEANRVFCTETEAYLLVKQYDSNSDGRLSLNEFCQLALPSANQPLRDIASSRRASLRLTPNVEFYLVRLFREEVRLQQRLESLKQTLSSRYDFTLMDCFSTVDAEKRSFLDRLQFQRFGRKNGFLMYDNELDALLRRLDLDGDELVSYSEFVDGVLPLRGEYAPKTFSSTTSFRRSASPLKRSGYSPLFESRITHTPSIAYSTRVASPLRASRGRSPLRSSPLRSSPLRSSPLRSSTLRNSSPQRSSPLRSSPLRASQRDSPMRSSPLRNSSPSRESPMRSSYRASSPLRASPKRVSFTNSNADYRTPVKSRFASPLRKSQSPSRRSLFESYRGDDIYPSPNKSAARY